MRKTIFITGQNELLKKPLVNLFLNNGYKAVTTILKGEESPQKDLYSIKWNMRSPLSAKNAVLEAVSQTESIDKIIILFPSTKINKPLHETSAAEIELSIDTHIKSILFIIKESLSSLQKQGAGALSLINYLPGAEIHPPLESLGQGSFSGLIKSLFAFYQNERVSINAFTSSSTEVKEYSEFIFKTISENQKITHGKLYKHSEKNVLSALGLSIKR